MADATNPIRDEDTLTVEVLPQAQLDTLAKEHGDVVAVQTKAGPAVFRVFKRQEYQRFNSMLTDDKKKHMALEYIVQACVVYPAHAEFDAMVARRPGIVASCANAVLEHGGVDGEPLLGKSSASSGKAI
jgi:hypothetical protein